MAGMVLLTAGPPRIDDGTDIHVNSELISILFSEAQCRTAAIVDYSLTGLYGYTYAYTAAD